MWLCGPLAGFIVQPCVGLYSDKCQSKFGRRRPFILAGCTLICLAVIVIGFSCDIGYVLGDAKEDCSVYHGARWKAALTFVGGFWVLDFANNAVQGPCRALMADLSGRFGCDAANAIFATWMAIGNILGYSSGSTGEWHNMTVTIIVGKEVPLSSTPRKGEDQDAKFLDIFKSIKNLPPGMPSVLLLSWFPFILFDTDWMGREVFHGDPKGTQTQIDAYDRGVRSGAFGLLLNAIVLCIGSFLITPLCQKLTPTIVWVMSNFMVCITKVATTIIREWSLDKYHGGGDSPFIGPDGNVKAVALFVFAALGFPMAVLFNVPFAVTASLVANKGGGQGLCTGVLNISIVIPQIIVALGAGPWDKVFDKGNTPAFALAAAIAFLCGVLGLFMLPKLSKSDFKSAGVGGGH